MIDWRQVQGFDWDEGNSRKSAEKHEVGQSESEQVFFNKPLLVLIDEKHSELETRYHALGKSDDDRNAARHIYSAIGRRLDSRLSPLETCTEKRDGFMSKL